MKRFELEFLFAGSFLIINLFFQSNIYKVHYNIELFTRLCGGGALFNPDEGIVRGWNGAFKPWIIIYNCSSVEVIKYW